MAILDMKKSHKWVKLSKRSH